MKSVIVSIMFAASMALFTSCSTSVEELYELECQINDNPNPSPEDVYNFCEAYSDMSLADRKKYKQYRTLQQNIEKARQSRMKEAGTFLKSSEAPKTAKPIPSNKMLDAEYSLLYKLALNK